jgi:diguanylate cyclase (GGDEF)-like protein/PAS domain S-box-containing protein
MDTLHKGNINLQQCFDTIDIMVVALDSHLKIKFINKKSEQILGYQKEDLIGQDWVEMCIPHSTRRDVRDTFTRLITYDGATTKKTKNCILKKDTKERKILWHNTVIKDTEGNITCILCLGEDISSSHEQAEKLKESQEKFKIICETAIDGIILINHHDKIVYWNKAAERIFGYSPDEALGKKLHALIVPERYYDFYKEGMKRFYSTGEGNVIGKTLEFEALKKDGHCFPIQLSVSSLKIKNQWHAVGFVSDITRKKRLEEQLKSRAIIDELTGLYNRRGFIEAAERQIRLGQRLRKSVALFFIDLDQLKMINDKFGHSTGDKALSDMATILQDTFRETDIVARIGGDEFIVLTMETGDYNTDMPVIRLLNNISEFNKKSGRPYELSASIGSSHTDSNTTSSIYDLLDQADEAMYMRKKE